MKRFLLLLLSGTLLLSIYAVRAQDGSVVEITPPPTGAQSVDTLSRAGTPAAQTIPDGWVKTGEYSILNPETNQWETFPTYGPPPRSIADLYMEGDYVWMSLITICLIAMLFAAWKAPRWVKELGLLALLLGLFYMMLGLYQISDLIAVNGYEIGKDISSVMLFGGLRVALIAPMYGMIAYGVSLVLRIVVKPRI